MFRTCNRCKLSRPLAKFKANKKCPDGREKICGTCFYKKTRVYRDKYAKAHPWYVPFYAMKYRCQNSKHEKYKNYGAKGVQMLLTMAQVKELWIRDNADSMKRPSIDRINSKGNYELSNCRFIEHSENSRKANLERYAK